MNQPDFHPRVLLVHFSSSDDASRVLARQAPKTCRDSLERRSRISLGAALSVTIENLVRLRVSGKALCPPEGERRRREYYQCLRAERRCTFVVVVTVFFLFENYHFLRSLPGGEI